MLFQLTTEQIAKLRENHVHASSAIIALANEAGFSKERIAKLSFPTIKHAATSDAEWEEFDKCFNAKHKKTYENKLRPKFLNGEEWRRVR